ncbi:hypothetical protein BLNAU_22724 [Blattamonas nauphoetae]|uniref:Uncharacterized protein n=1 Tax=Blattamonas nauphoetae TaxID=2049346 RepID=A0ABQ9WSA2_9EUKA|nr:hypothetical protein BLNAU_22724 [Blattamonas nauphoetae]
MTSFDIKTDPSSNPARADLSSSQLPSSTDFSPFLNWNEEEFLTESEKAVIFRSLVAIVKLQTAVDDSLEVKAVKLLKSLDAEGEDSADAFLTSHGHTTEESLKIFIQSIVVLISSTNQTITTAAMEMLDSLIWNCSTRIRLALIKADLIPQLVVSLNPLSLSFAEAVDIHTALLSSTLSSLWLATPDCLASLGIEDNDDHPAVHETVFQQVLTPSEQYIWHLYVNRFSIIDGDLSWNFLNLFAFLLLISPFYQPTMDLVVHMPVVLTIPSCLTFFEFYNSIYWFLSYIVAAQRYWNKTRGAVRQMWKNMLRMLRMEGFEDVMEDRLQNDRNERFGEWIFISSIEWNNLLGMNLPEQE